MVRWMTVFAVALMPVLALAQVDEKTIELDRLRRENAQLKKDLAGLKEQLAKVTADLEKAKSATKAATAPPKVTRYTPQDVFALIPREDRPDGQKWEETKRFKAMKIIEAQLVGEWVEFSVSLNGPASNDAPYKMFARVELLPISFVLDLAFTERYDKRIRPGQALTVSGRVARVAILPDGGPLILCLEETKIK